jgi:hypothetical protein
MLPKTTLCLIGTDCPLGDKISYTSDLYSKLQTPTATELFGLRDTGHRSHPKRSCLNSKAQQ